MKMFYVYKKKYSEYAESRGRVVLAKDWKRAKGIALAPGSYWDDEDKNNFEVRELDISDEGIICETNYIQKSKWGE